MSELTNVCEQHGISPEDLKAEIIKLEVEMLECGRLEDIILHGYQALNSEEAFDRYVQGLLDNDPDMLTNLITSVKAKTKEVKIKELIDLFIEISLDQVDQEYEDSLTGCSNYTWPKQALETIESHRQFFRDHLYSIAEKM